MQHAPCEARNESPRHPFAARTPTVSETVGRAVNRIAGAPLDCTVRTKYEAVFRSDLSGVRIHVGDDGAANAEALSASAYTIGTDIFFARDRYRPETARGAWLLSHELAHVVQQRPETRIATTLAVSSPEDLAESEASRAADAIARGDVPTVSARSEPPSIHRQSSDVPSNSPQASEPDPKRIRDWLVKHQVVEPVGSEDSGKWQRGRAISRPELMKTVSSAAEELHVPMPVVIDALFEMLGLTVESQPPVPPESTPVTPSGPERIRAWLLEHGAVSPEQSDFPTAGPNASVSAIVALAATELRVPMDKVALELTKMNAHASAKLPRGKDESGTNTANGQSDNHGQTETKDALKSRLELNFMTKGGGSISNPRFNLASSTPISVNRPYPLITAHPSISGTEFPNFVGTNIDLRLLKRGPYEWSVGSEEGVGLGDHRLQGQFAFGTQLKRKLSPLFSWTGGVDAASSVVKTRREPGAGAPKRRFTWSSDLSFSTGFERNKPGQPSTLGLNLYLQKSLNERKSGFGFEVVYTHKLDKLLEIFH
jgi:hypothetical protein